MVHLYFRSFNFYSILYQIIIVMFIEYTFFFSLSILFISQLLLKVLYLFSQKKKRWEAESKPLDPNPRTTTYQGRLEELDKEVSLEEVKEGLSE